MKDLKQFLLNKGFKEDRYGYYNEYTTGYFRRVDDVPHCELNDKLTIGVEDHELIHNRETHHSIEVIINAEVNDVWAALSCYSMSPDEFIKNYDRVIRSTIEAWKAFYKTMKENCDINHDTVS